MDKAALAWATENALAALKETRFRRAGVHKASAEFGIDIETNYGKMIDVTFLFKNKKSSEIRVLLVFWLKQQKHFAEVSNSPDTDCLYVVFLQ